MKRLFLIFAALVLLTSCVSREANLKDLFEGAEQTGADQKLTALTNINTAIKNADEMYLVDSAGPTSMAVDGRRTKQFIINSYSSDQTLTAAAHAGTIVKVTDPADITLWSCTDSAGTSYSIGDWVIIWVQDAEIASGVPASGEHFNLFAGTALSANNEIDMPASGNESAGSKFTLVCTAAGTWSVFNETATSGDGGAAD